MLNDIESAQTGGNEYILKMCYQTTEKKDPQELGSPPEAHAENRSSQRRSLSPTEIFHSLSDDLVGESGTMAGKDNTPCWII